MKNMILKFNWLNPKVESKKSIISGKGIYTKESIKKNELIAAFGGHIITNKQYKKLPKEINKFPIQISENLCVASKKKGEIDDGDLVNHSCYPNAGIKGQILLVALRDIKKGEEITFDYAMSETTLKKFRCKCGQKNCRKIITKNDWKKKELQQRYKGYFSLYIEEKINKSTPK